MAQLTDAPTSVPVSGVRRPVRRWRRVLVLTAVLLVATLVSGWVWAGHQVRLGPGSWARVVGPGLGGADDGFGQTRWTVRGPGPISARLDLTVRNDGRLPLTILGDDTGFGVANPYVQDVTFAPLDQRAPLSDESLRRPGSQGIHLEPGQEAQLRLEVHADRCTTPYGGASTTIPTVRLRVRQLGITTSNAVPLRYPVTLIGPSAPRPADC